MRAWRLVSPACMSPGAINARKLWSAMGMREGWSGKARSALKGEPGPAEPGHALKKKSGIHVIFKNIYYLTGPRMAPGLMGVFMLLGRLLCNIVNRHPAPAVLHCKGGPHGDEVFDHLRALCRSGLHEGRHTAIACSVYRRAFLLNQVLYQ